uniref:Putative secreted protein n=1 Tax=Anopheles darlingi TaxID=43151 RepID=A0A2M4DLC7_ANODA
MASASTVVSCEAVCVCLCGLRALDKCVPISSSPPGCSGVRAYRGGGNDRLCCSLSLSLFLSNPTVQQLRVNTAPALHIRLRKL